jgi:hypothetical protein
MCIPCRERALQLFKKRKASIQLQPENPPNGVKNPFNALETIIRANNMPRETVLLVQLALQLITALVTRP